MALARDNRRLKNVLDNLHTFSDSSEMLETLQYAMRLAETASGTNLAEIMDILNRTKKAMNNGETAANVDNGINLRSKRDIANSSQSQPKQATTTTTPPQTMPTPASVIAGITKTTTATGGGGGGVATTATALPTTAPKKIIDETTVSLKNIGKCLIFPMSGDKAD